MPWELHLDTKTNTKYWWHSETRASHWAVPPFHIHPPPDERQNRGQPSGTTSPPLSATAGGGGVGGTTTAAASSSNSPSSARQPLPPPGAQWNTLQQQQQQGGGLDTGAGAAGAVTSNRHSYAEGELPGSRRGAQSPSFNGSGINSMPNSMPSASLRPSGRGSPEIIRVGGGQQQQQQQQQQQFVGGQYPNNARSNTPPPGARKIQYQPTSYSGSPQQQQFVRMTSPLRIDRQGGQSPLGFPQRAAQPPPRTSEINSNGINPSSSIDGGGGGGGLQYGAEVMTPRGDGAIVTSSSPTAAMIVGNLQDKLIPSLPVATLRKKALLVGINYPGTSSQLTGCVNDAMNMQYLLWSQYDFAVDAMLVLTDEGNKDPATQPTCANIINGIKWLLHGASPGDSLVFLFSGHGSQMLDGNDGGGGVGGKQDGVDYTVCPSDFVSGGQIADDQLNDLLVKPLPLGTKLFSIIDCCHTNTGIDLPFRHHAVSSHVRPGVLSRPLHYPIAASPPEDLFGPRAVTVVGDWVQMRPKQRDVQQYGPNSPVPAGDVVALSGFREVKSGTKQIPPILSGAMTYAFIVTIERNKHKALTYAELLDAMRRELVGKFSQIPEISTARPFDLYTTRFSL